MSTGHHELKEEAAERSLRALNSVMAGEDCDEAVLASGLLRVFDGVPVDVVPSEVDPQYRAEQVAEVLSGMRRCCSTWRSDQDAQELVGWYTLLAGLVPGAVWRHQLRSAAAKVASRVHLSEELVVARARAVEQLGSAVRLGEAIDAWEPDADERERLQRMLSAGREVEAVVQALEQAVFALELSDL